MAMSQINQDFTELEDSLALRGYEQPGANTTKRMSNKTKVNSCHGHMWQCA